MRPPVTYLARIVIEFPHGFRVGTGIASDQDDDLVLTDANGLPFIPGTSLTGAFRSQLTSDPDAWPRECVERLFGFQHSEPRPGSDYPEGQGSRLSLSHAHLLDAQGNALEGLSPRFLTYRPSGEAVVNELSPETGRLSPIIESALLPTLRDHVRINSKGVADHRGKFTRSHIMGGHRFAFDLTLEGNPEDEETWNALLDAWKSSEFRLGGATRQGLGRFRTILIRGAVVDLRTPEGWNRWKQISTSLTDHNELPVLWHWKSEPVTPSKGIQIQFRLEARGAWMFGGPQRGGVHHPLEGRRIAWAEDETGSMTTIVMDQCSAPDQQKAHQTATTAKGNLGREAGEKGACSLIPFTGIKGPIRHRLIFHYNRLKEHWADSTASTDPSPGDEAARQLFGWASDQPRSNPGKPGVFVGDDVHALPSEVHTTKRLDHVALDPFTGGPVPGALFSEHPQWQGSFSWGFTITNTQPLEQDPVLLQALIATLEDLGRGDLVLGKGAGKGRFQIDAAELAFALKPLKDLLPKEESIP